MRHCPKCQTLMESEIVRVVELERCPACRGMLLDRGELGLLVKRRIGADSGARAGATRTALSDRSSATCYDCAVAMERQQVGGVTVDSCPSCEAVFLDQGELNRIQSQSR